MERKLIPVKLDNYKPLREIVFESIREAIINGTLKQGERLMETQLAEELGVSRTPVREAIRKLELEGLVVMLPRKGAYVAGIMPQDVADILEIRAVLEGLAAKLAAERISAEELQELKDEVLLIEASLAADNIEEAIEADTKFHRNLIAASKNSRLIGIVSNLQEQIQRFRVMLTKERHDLMKSSCEEHHRIIEALSSKSQEEAQRLAKIHVEKTENYIIQLINKGTEEESDG